MRLAPMKAPCSATRRSRCSRPALLAPPVAYGLLDGLFQQALLAYVGGHTDVLDTLVTQVRAVMPLMLATPTPPAG